MTYRILEDQNAGVTVIDLNVTHKDGWVRHANGVTHDRGVSCSAHHRGAVWHEMVSHGPSAIVTVTCNHYVCDCGAHALVVFETRKGVDTPGGPYGPASESVIELLDAIGRLSLADVMAAVAQWMSMPVEAITTAWRRALTIAREQGRGDAMDASLRTIEERVIQLFERLESEYTNGAESYQALCYSMIDVACAAAMVMVVGDLCEDTNLSVLSDAWEMSCLSVLRH